MLVSAYGHEEKLNEKLIETWYNEKYKFYHNSWHEKLNIGKNDWNKRH